MRCNHILNMAQKIYYGPCHTWITLFVSFRKSLVSGEIVASLDTKATPGARIVGTFSAGMPLQRAYDAINEGIESAWYREERCVNEW